MKSLDLVLLFFILTTVDSINKTKVHDHNDDLPSYDDLPASNDSRPRHDLPTRRVLRGHHVGDTRPYMVYLRPAADEKNRVLYESHWLCGGVIINQRYILTSAACIEDAGNFYVIAGTHRFVPPHVRDNECVINGAKKAVWKCIPKAYFFDGDAFDNIRWMVGDIAIVKVEDNFNFARRIKGCDFVPKMVAFNNRSKSLEKSGTLASLAGWGTGDRFINIDAGTLRNGTEHAQNSPELLEADVILISKKGCKKHWDPRYHFIIQNEMVCSKDSTDYEPVGAECLEHGVNCKEVGHSDEDYYDDTRMGPPKRRMIDRENEIVHTAAHQSPTRRSRLASGGFCENDHGGPLVVGQGKSTVVIGIMSACITRELSHKCHGPFLFTSVFKYKSLISCAIDKSLQEECNVLLRSTNTQLKKTVFDWRGRPLSQGQSREVESRWYPQRKNSPTQERNPNAVRNEEYNLSRQQSPQAQLSNQESHYTTPEDSLGGIKKVIMRRFYN